METAYIPILVKAKVKELDPQAEVILFGSRARGDYREDSDWDFLIFLSAQENDKDLKRYLRDQLIRVGIGNRCSDQQPGPFEGQMGKASGYAYQ